MGPVELIGTVIVGGIVGILAIVLILCVIAVFLTCLYTEYTEDPKGFLWSFGLITLIVLGFVCIFIGQTYGI